jgi:hypothetical protein
VAQEQSTFRRVLKAIVITAIVVVVAYYALDQIPHALRPTLQPKSGAGASS